MRVGFLLEQVLAPVPGGTGRYARELAAALVATAPPGSRVEGWTAWHRDVAAAEVAGAGGPTRLPLPRRGLVAAWERGLGPAPRADVIHAPTPLAPPRRRTPLVVTVHDAVPWTHPETLTPRGVAWHRAAIATAAREADRIVVPTHAVATDLRAAVDLAETKLVVLGEGVARSLRQEPADADEIAKRLGLPDEYVLSLATLEPRKGLDVLLAAMALPGAPDLPVLLVGQPGWGGVDPLDEARRRNVDARTLGRIPDRELAVVLHRASVLAAPSRAEGFGLPVLEAMAAGVPVVTSDAPALVEVGGGAPIVVPRDDPEALAEALSRTGDLPTRERMIKAGLTRADHYSWSTTASALWTLYSVLAT